MFGVVSKLLPGQYLAFTLYRSQWVAAVSFGIFFPGYSVTELMHNVFMVLHACISNETFVSVGHFEVASAIDKSIFRRGLTTMSTFNGMKHEMLCFV